MKNIFKHIKGDFFGGLTAGIVALPLALAFGVSSGLGASAGLYGALFLSFFRCTSGRYKYSDFRTNCTHDRFEHGNNIYNSNYE